MVSSRIIKSNMSTSTTIIFPPIPMEKEKKLPPLHSSSMIVTAVAHKELENELGTKPPGWEMTIPFSIDFAFGELTINKDEEHHEESIYPHDKPWTVYFMYFFMRWHTVSKEFHNPSEVVNYIQKLGNARFVRPNEILSVDEFVTYTRIHKNIMLLTGKEMDICYVCHEASYGHKTQCHHDICLSCWYKSCRRRSYDQAEFKCGICRRKWRSSSFRETDSDDDSDDE